MSSASFRKNRFFGPGRRLAAPEGPKIAGGASLCEGKSLIPGHPSGGRVLRARGRASGSRVASDTGSVKMCGLGR